MGRWTGKVVVVTGAGSGIGRSLARLLDSRGARLALSDVNLHNVTETAAGLRDARAYLLDVADRDAVKAHAEQVVADFGRVDMVVNNAGVALAAEVAEQSDEDIDWLLDINLRGVISGTQAFLPHVIATRGNVVNISSIFGIMAMPSQSIYNAAKFGVRGYTEALAIEMDRARTGVGVHCVHPGGIKTNIATASRRPDTAEANDVIERFNRVMLRTSADEAARVIVRGVERGRRKILIGADAWAVMAAERLLGHRYQHVIARATSWILPPRALAPTPTETTEDPIEAAVTEAAADAARTTA